MNRALRIAHVAPPFERVPPLAYGGTERVVYELVRELDRRGHDITTFASGDSDVPGRLVPTVEKALRPDGYIGETLPYMLATMRSVLDHATEFDLIHRHLEWANLMLARVSPVPVVSTFHGRLDLPWATEALTDPPAGLVAISDNQASTHPDVPWTVIHNGLTLTDAPFERRRGDAMCFVGRVAPEKGIVEALEIAAARRAAAADRREGGPDRSRARLLRGRVRAGAQGRRLRRRVPRRAHPGATATTCSPRASSR